MSLRILYIATADARGHLMRCQLLVHALREAGCHVDVLTTSQAGVSFLAEFGIAAQLLSPHYAVQFDAQQNMLRSATDRNVAHYVFRPSRMLKDMVQLSRRLGEMDLVINDSFHPALLCMGIFPWWGRKTVHVYGGSLKAALVANFEGRIPAPVARAFAAIVGWQINSALCCLEHDFSCDEGVALAPMRYRLPTPVAVARSQSPNDSKHDAAAIYLNPHFQNAALADALCAGLKDAQLALHQVGEGLAGHSAWQAVDNDWVSHAAHSCLIVSAPGMAALSAARIYQRPILLVLTDQPEQAANAAKAVQLQLAHRAVVWLGDEQDFRRKVHEAALALLSGKSSDDVAAGQARAKARIAAWVRILLSLKPLRV